MQKMNIKMEVKKQSLERVTMDEYSSHRVRLDDTKPLLTKEEALILISRIMLDQFMETFVSLWQNNFFPHVMTNDYKVTDKDRQCHPEKDYKDSKYCKEVKRKMDKDLKQRLDSYLELLDDISEKTDNESTAVALLQEISKDRRMERIREEQSLKNEDQPATEKQKKFMSDLNIEFADDITKKQASFLIDTELGKTGLD